MESFVHGRPIGIRRTAHLPRNGSSAKLYVGKRLYDPWVSADGLRMYYNQHENDTIKEQNPYSCSWQCKWSMAGHDDIYFHSPRSCIWRLVRLIFWWTYHVLRPLRRNLQPVEGNPHFYNSTIYESCRCSGIEYWEQHICAVFNAGQSDHLFYVHAEWTVGLEPLHGNPQFLIGSLWNIELLNISTLWTPKHILMSRQTVLYSISAQRKGSGCRSKCPNRRLSPFVALGMLYLKKKITLLISHGMKKAEGLSLQPFSLNEANCSYIVNRSFYGMGQLYFSCTAFLTILTECLSFAFILQFNNSSASSSAILSVNTRPLWTSWTILFRAKVADHQRLAENHILKEFIGHAGFGFRGSKYEESG